MTTACDRFRAQLDSWLDDELDAADRAELALHLDTCEPCRAFFGRASAVADRLSALGTVADAIASAGEPAITRQSPRLRPLVRIAAMIALLAMAGLAWRFGVRSHATLAPVAQQSLPNIAAPVPDRPATDDDQLIVASSTPNLAVHMKSENPRVQIVMFYEPMVPAMPQTTAPNL